LGSELTELIPLALVVAVSPLSIIPAVLVLHTPRPKPTSLAYLAGWIFGLAALTAIFVEVSSLLGGLNKTPPWGFLGAHRDRYRAHRVRRVPLADPQALRAFAGLDEEDHRCHPGPGGGHRGGIGGGEPKVLIICAAAGLAIGSAGLGTAGAWISVVFYVLVAASSAAIPVLAYAVAGERLDGPLTRLKDWMERHNAALVAAILVIIGVLLLYKGIHGLSP
jgi:MFS family permease